MVSNPQRGKLDEKFVQIVCFDSGYAGHFFPASAMEVTFDTGVANRGLDFVGGAVLEDGPVALSEVAVASSNGCYFGIWNAKTLSDHSERSFENEVDCYVGRSWEIGSFEIDTGAMYCDSLEVFNFGQNDSWCGYLEVGHEIEIPEGLEPITVFGKYEGYQTLPGTDYEGGNYFHLGARKNQEYQSLSLDVEQTFTYDDGAFGLGRGILAKLKIGLTWQLSEHVSLVAPKVTGYLPITINDERNPEAVIYAGIKIQ